LDDQRSSILEKPKFDARFEKDYLWNKNAVQKNQMFISQKIQKML
jgi:hypothetical protein